MGIAERRCQRTWSVRSKPAPRAPSDGVPRDHAKRGLPGRCALPNILVYIDVRDGRPTGPSLFALSEARRIARVAGASTFAVLATPPLATDDLEAVARPVAEAGADKLLLCEAADFGDLPTDATHGRALDSSAARVPPLLFLFPAGSPAGLGPSLAARLGGPFAPWCDFLTTAADVPLPPGVGRVQLVYLRRDGRSRRRLDPLEIERPIVATLGAGRCPPSTGSIQHLEIEIVASGIATDRPIPIQRDRVPNPHSPFQLAPVVVLIADRGQLGPLGDISPEELAANLPADSVVARASEVPPSVLASCCPDLLLKIGPSAATTARSPRTRVVLALPEGPVPGLEDSDVLWQIHPSERLTSASLASLIAEIEGRS
jgi:Electron transfer flavoprotein domain